MPVASAVQALLIAHRSSSFDQTRGFRGRYDLPLRLADNADMIQACHVDVAGSINADDTTLNVDWHPPPHIELEAKPMKIENVCVTRTVARSRREDDQVPSIVAALVGMVEQPQHKACCLREAGISLQKTPELLAVHAERYPIRSARDMRTPHDAGTEHEQSLPIDAIQRTASNVCALITRQQADHTEEGTYAVLVVAKFSTYFSCTESLSSQSPQRRYCCHCHDVCLATPLRTRAGSLLAAFRARRYAHLGRMWLFLRSTGDLSHSLQMSDIPQNLIPPSPTTYSATVDHQLKSATLANSCEPNTHGCRAFFVVNYTHARLTSTRSTVSKELGNLNRKVRSSCAPSRDLRRAWRSMNMPSVILHRPSEPHQIA